MSLSTINQEAYLDRVSQTPQYESLGIIAKHANIIAFLVITIGTIVRLWFIATGKLNLSPDEAQYWDWSRNLQLSYYSKGPLISWNIAFWCSIFGNTEFAVRFGAVFNSVIAQLIFFFAVSHIFRRKMLAVLCLLVANTMPLFLASAILMTTDNPLLIAWLSAFFALYVISENPDSKSKKTHIAYVMLFVAMAMGNLAKYMMLAFIAVAFFYLLILHKHSLVTKKQIAKIILIMLAGSGVGLLPILIWNAMNNWVGFFHVTSLAGVTGYKAKEIFDLPAIPEFIGGQLGVATPWWLCIAFMTSLRYMKNAYRGEHSKGIFLDMPAWLQAISQKRKNNKEIEEEAQHNNTSTESTRLNNLNTKLSAEEIEKIDTYATQVRYETIRQEALLACGFLTMLLPFFVWSFHTNIYANWPAMAYVSGILLASSGFEFFLLGFGNPRLKKFAPAWLYLGIFVSFVLYFNHAFTLPPKFDPTLRLKGWEDLSYKLQEVQQSFDNPEKVFYFSSRYDATAGLAFYAPNKPRSYNANFSDRLSQYDLWENPSNKAFFNPDNTEKKQEESSKIGWDAIYLYINKLDHPENLLNPLKNLFEKVELIEYTSQHNGKPGRDFYIVKCYNYNGKWAEQKNYSY